MIKNILLHVLISSLIAIQSCSIFTTNIVYATANMSLEALNLNVIEVPHDKEKIERFWNTENMGFLNSDELEILNKFKTKVDNGENLTVEERGQLSELRSSTIRKKLGDERYERYRKLIEKREKQEKGKLEIEMTKEEKREIYMFEKEIIGKK